MMRYGNVSYLFGADPVMPVAASPTSGYYYQVKKGDTAWAISKKAYVTPGLTDVKTGLFLLNDNPANAHIDHAKTGWESYNVKGLQLNPKYAEGDADAVKGSGKAYPLLWIPPLDGRTPSQMSGTGTPGATGATGAKGAKGAKGEKGDKGDPGHTPTAAEIAELISAYMDEHPVAGKPTAAELADAVAGYMSANPVAQGAQGPRGPAGPAGEPGKTPSMAEIAELISAYMDEHPVAGKLTAAELASAVAGYMSANPVAQGAQGPRGPQGETGPQGKTGPAGATGPSPTDAQIQAAVNSYMASNPVRTTAVQTSSAAFSLDDMNWQMAATILIGGLLGAMALGGMQKMKRRKSGSGSPISMREVMGA